MGYKYQHQSTIESAVGVVPGSIEFMYSVANNTRSRRWAPPALLWSILAKAFTARQLIKDAGIRSASV
jgi:hypothetical protein